MQRLKTIAPRLLETPKALSPAAAGAKAETTIGMS